MKSFSSFIQEAVVSRAVEKAKRMGLVSDGHGNWYDRQGSYKGRTYKGDLLLSKGKDPGKEDPAPQQKRAATPEDGQKTAEQPRPDTNTPSSEGESESAKEREGEALTIAFGRFNPPTSGHEKLLDATKRQAKGGDYKIYPSRSEDPKKNPLSPDEKISYMRKMYPTHDERIVNDEGMRSIFDVLKKANEDGYSSVNIMVGADRQGEFEKLATKYNGELYDFDEINVISAGERDPDAEGVEGMSASKLRKAAADGDFETFKTGVPKALDDESAQKLFNTIVKKMGKKKVTETWQIAPKLDWKGLRENYINNIIFKLGDVVESLNNGLIGRITRRGTNHLICVTEDNIMFKSWIRDLNEFTEVSGVPASQREVGTDSFRRYAMKMTGTKQIKNFINKNKKKS
jgi:hypothetical protein